VEHSSDRKAPHRHPVRACSAVCIAIAGLGLSSGCATTFKENHYYQAVNPKTKQVSNYYRLAVNGYAAMSSARYISGFYDERAVDLYFNEVKVAESPDGDTSTQTLFKSDLKEPGAEDVIKPLSPDKQHGAFVMILSTNASSVSRAIGQFAENQVVADAITNLANRDALLRAKSAAVARSASADATADEIARLVGQLPTSAVPAAAETETALLRLANSLGTALTSHPVAFATLDQAATWFAQFGSGEGR